MKKFFAWALVLAMVLTMMPVMDEHNHAHAAYIYGDCKCGSCSGWVPGNTMLGKTVCAKCACTEQSHITGCDHANAQYYPNYGDEYYNTHERYCKADLCPEKRSYVDEPHVWVDGKCVCGVTQHTCTEFDVDINSPIEQPTCNSYGGYTGICKECGDSQFIPFTAYDPTNHSWKNDGTCANGCGEKCEHVKFVDNKCAVCGCPDHVHPDEAFTDTLKTPGNCVKGAVYTRTYACGATEAVTYPIDRNAHTWAPTGQCANTGCNQACTHNWVDGVCTECTFVCVHAETTQTTTVPGNCKNVGSADLICDECGEITDTVELPIDEDNHEWVVFPFGAGYCVRCNEVNVNYDDFEDVLPEKEPVENPCDEHQWASLAFGAWYCTKCGATATDIKPLEPEVCDHADTYIEVVEAATCKKEGSAKEICDICETVLDANVVLPIDKENGHDLVIFPFGASWCNLCHEINVDYEDFIEPENPQDSCDHEWVSFPFGVWLCPKCMLQTEEDPTVPVEPEEPKYCENNEHQWASLAFGAWYCTKCGASATDIKPLDPDICDHADTYIDVTTPATCVATGIGNKMCDICETVLAVGLEVEIDPDAHQWGADANGNACCLLCGLYESELPKEEPCEHEWAAVATGWYCWKCNTVTLDDPFATEPVVLLGDVNDDGCVDGRDEVRLMKYLVGQGVHINKLNADLNGDGVIDGRDEIRLLYRLL